MEEDKNDGHNGRFTKTGTTLKIKPSGSPCYMNKKKKKKKKKEKKKKVTTFEKSCCYCSTYIVHGNRGNKSTV